MRRSAVISDRSRRLRTARWAVMTLWSAYGRNSAFGVDNVPHGASQALMPDGNHVLAGLRARDGTAGRRPPWCRVKWYHTGSYPAQGGAGWQLDPEPNGKKPGQADETGGGRDETREARPDKPARQDFVSLHL
jgi:hypothetical protein